MTMFFSIHITSFTTLYIKYHNSIRFELVKFSVITILAHLYKFKKNILVKLTAKYLYCEKKHKLKQMMTKMDDWQKHIDFNALKNKYCQVNFMHKASFYSLPQSCTKLLDD